MRKKLAAIAIVAGVSLAASAAFAYWTANGSGSDTASVGTDSGVTVTINDFDGADLDTDDDTLYPGYSIPVHFTVENNSASSKVSVDRVVQDGPVTFAAVGEDCVAAWFTFAPVDLDGPASAENLILNENGSAGDSVDGTGSLALSDLPATNQDSCKTAAPTLKIKVDNTGIGGL
ncbi:MAG: hypothetical protein ACRD0C_08765 [Acidimicrobiia bacterium]